MAMVAVTAVLIGFFAFVIMRVTTPQMTTLFTDLSVEDSSGIIKDALALAKTPCCAGKAPHLG